jgi:Membrane-associated phospholipid phosphatase
VLVNHRRAFVYSLGLIGACLFMLVAVGRHPAAAAPVTTLPAVGVIDHHVYDWMDSIRNAVLTGFFRFLNVLGGGIVTIPVRSIALIVLALRRRWRAFFAFALTWLLSEVSLTIIKSYFHRGRPPGSLVSVLGASFPSGHALAGTATAVALVLAFFPPGPRRRKWEWIAVAFSFVMAFSRVYLWAHWFSDVVTGVLLGAGIALGSAALVTEIRDIYFRRKGIAIPSPGPSPGPSSGSSSGPSSGTSGDVDPSAGQPAPTG